MRSFTFLCFITMLLNYPCFSETVYFVPPSGINATALFTNEHSYRDEVAKPFVVLREQLEKAGYTVKFTSNAESLEDFYAIIILNDFSSEILNNLAKYPKERCFHFIFEPPTVHPHFYSNDYSSYFKKIYTMFDDMVDNIHYFKFNYPQPRLNMIDNILDFEKKTLCTLIASNKSSGHPDEAYSFRREAIGFFETLPSLTEFDLYGSGWEGKNYRGGAGSKWEIYSNHKFCFAYENMTNQRGYITEKIFDAFVGGCVPIYLGASNITDYVPSQCFIDRKKFKSDKELYHFISFMDKHTYEQYMGNIKIFLASPQAQHFSSEYFSQIILKDLKALVE